MKDIIRQAIEDKQLISFEYDGHTRIVEPHTFGVSRTGKDVFRGYQVDGTSSDGVLDWKLFSLAKATAIKLIDKHFDKARNGYIKGDSAMDRIYIEV